VDKNSNLKEDNIIPLPVPYHVVIESHKGEHLFVSDKVCNNLAYILFETSVLHEYGLFAFCIMPDHTHILCRPGNVAVCHFINLVKLRFEFMHKKNMQKRTIWHSTSRQDMLADEQIVSTAKFILDNPVRNGLAPSAIDYPFSFAYGEKTYCP
jgi:REP element-mobilizing transposase RayT